MALIQNHILQRDSHQTFEIVLYLLNSTTIVCTVHIRQYNYILDCTTIVCEHIRQCNYSLYCTTTIVCKVHT